MNSSKVSTPSATAPKLPKAGAIKKQRNARTTAEKQFLMQAWKENPNPWQKDFCERLCSEARERGFHWQLWKGPKAYKKM